MIETIAIFGGKPQTRTLAVALAATEKYLVDVYAPSPQGISLYTKASKAAKLKPLSLLFTRSVHNTAWGADAIILDSIKHIHLLPEIAPAANDKAILAFAGDLSGQDERTLKAALKNTTLIYVAPAHLKRAWPDFPLSPS